METVKIDVPNFDGYEAFYGDPKIEDNVMIVDGKGERLIPARGWLNPQVCYRKIPPQRLVLELVGTNTAAYPGQYYRLPDGTFMIERGDDIHSKHREVWRVVEGE
jgi:hypothetical protein